MNIKQLFFAAIIVGMASTGAEAKDRHNKYQHNEGAQHTSHKEKHSGRRHNGYQPSKPHHRRNYYQDQRHRPEHHQTYRHGYPSTRRHHNHYRKHTWNRHHYYQPHHPRGHVTHRNHRVLPMIAGATIGGVIGHEVGRNNHNAQTGVIIGGVIGAVIGHELGRDHKAQNHKKNRRYGGNHKEPTVYRTGGKPKYTRHHF